MRTSSTPKAGIGLRISTALIVAFLYAPLLVTVLYSFTTQTASFTKAQPLHPSPVADWELRVGDFRVLYNVREEELVVEIVGIGVKDRRARHRASRPSGGAAASA